MNKFIPLSQGQFAIVDDRDYEWLMQWKWHLCRGYAVRHTSRNNGHKWVAMHREILGINTGEVCDHINGNRSDNRRCNLRSCTPAQNSFNRSLHKNNTTGSKGVYFRKKRKLFEAKITVNKKPIYLGEYKTKEEAEKAYKQAAPKYHGEFVRV